MRIEALDLGVDSVMAEQYRLYLAHMSHDRADQPTLGQEALRASMLSSQPGTSVEHWGARDAEGTLVGYFDMVLPERENRAHVHSIGWVHPEFRRRGVATALYRRLGARARDLDRHAVTFPTYESVPGGIVGHPIAGAAFCESVGLTRALVEIRRRLDVTTVDSASLNELAARAWTRAAEFEVVTWRDRADDSLVADLAYLESRLHSDVPTGDLEWEAAEFDVARWRGLEEMAAKRKRTQYYAAARHRPTGRLAAYTALIVPQRPRSHAIQQTTVVAPEHRGRRLGTIVKLANLRESRLAEPDLKYIDTTNADENDHMIAINDAMGFVLCDATVSWQGPIKTIQ
ncbi:GNAT family N-acetyltransferase [Stackebrandtia soli]|uniref:GNAT family N-acetyltransferase n=1 Tax=Stackebrandtia soli TaxID=1892856 RepID=UPI0039EA165B